MDIQNIENHKAQLRKGALDFCILLVIGEGEAYTSDIITELQESNLIVVEGTLYPLLSRLRSSGLLDYSWVESPSGPPRKYYRLTKEGQKTLEQLKENWESFSHSINTLIKKHEKDSNN